MQKFKISKGLGTIVSQTQLNTVQKNEKWSKMGVIKLAITL